MFAPAVHLPIWGSILQVGLCFAAAETILGARLAIFFGVLGHFVATMAGRFFLWLGPKVIFGLPAWIAHVHDNGPSAATITLGMILAWKVRSWLLAAGILIFVVSESFVLPGLTAHEHIVAICFATLSYFVWQNIERIRNAMQRRKSTTHKSTFTPAAN